MSKINNNFDLNSLIIKVRDGDQMAFLTLLERYEPLLHSQVAKFANDDTARAHYEDLLQEATLVFYNAILNYDETQSDVEFGLYARICIYNALVSQMRIINKRKAEELTEPDSRAFCDDIAEDPAENLVEAENIREIYSVIKKNLSDYEYEIWRSYMLGKTARQIGEAISRDERSVSNAVYRIRKKLRTLLK